jgi:hypothetical protein
MRSLRNAWIAGSLFVVALAAAQVGCNSTPIDTSVLHLGPAPMRIPSSGAVGDGCSYEDSLTGGQIFSMYCNYCHNAPALAERPFSNFQNVAVHMRIRASLTGKEYAKLVEFLRRWHDVPSPNPPLEPTPKRFIYSQPMQELREQEPAQEQLPPPKMEESPQKKEG